MDQTITVGSRVTWKWLGRTPSGEVIEIVPQRTEIVSKGSLIVRNGTHENPALIIRQQNGTLVLKLISEVQLSD
jgi:hypothetical protein